MIDTYFHDFKPQKTYRTMINLKHNTHIQYIIIFAVLLSGMLMGCEDQLLDKSPRGQLTQKQFFENEEDAVQATNATYQQLRNFNVHSFPWLGLTDIASDDANKGSTPADGAFLREMDEFTFTPSNNAFNGPWNAYYNGIFRANTAINRIPDIDMNPDLRARLVGENKFIRAYFYFFLVRSFGGVPLHLIPADDADEFQKPRSSAEDVYTQIEKDLTDAIPDLPLQSELSSGEVGRVTQGAAQGMLAKVHLFQDEFEDAQELAEDVIESNEYTLLSDYDKIFKPEGENNTGTVWSVQAVAVATGTGGTPYSVVQGVRGTPNLGWGFNNPNRDLLNAFESGDPRMGEAVLFTHELLPFGPTDVVRDNPNMVDERFNQKSFIPTDNPNGNFNGGSNIRRLRYADVLLIAAEAAAENNNPNDARRYVNMVRERARDGRTASIGVEVENVSELIADTVGLDIAGQPFVRFANEGGPAANAGLGEHTWDLEDNQNVIEVTNLEIIESVNGVAVSNTEEFEQQMAGVSLGDNVSVAVTRVTETFDGSTGQKSTQTQDLNLNLTAVELLPDITSSGQQLIEDIWHERRVELAMEQHRFFDIRRQGRAGELLRAQGQNFENPKHELYPIPQNEMDLNQNMEQNPRYN